MSILTQKIEIYDDSNPLESKIVEIPVHKGIKLMCNKPYVMEALKKYTSSCSDEVIQAITNYESVGTFRDVREGMISNYNPATKSADVYLSEKHVVKVNIAPTESVNVGDKIDVVVTKNKGRLIGDASSKSAQTERLRQELIKEIQTPTSAYVGTVKEIAFNGANVFNGFMVDIKGVKCFMPGTESDVVPLNNFNDLIGKELYVMPVNVIKDSIVVSHKEYLNTLKPSVIDALTELEKGTVVSGVISSVKNFGVFILIKECVATLLSVSEMDELTESKFKAGQLKAGDTIDFYIDNVTDDRVVVTQTVSKSEGWEKLKEVVASTENYQLKGVVKNIFNNGVVILSEEFNGITFFLSSKVVEISNITVGQDVSLPVDSVDTVKKTVRLKITQ